MPTVRNPDETVGVIADPDRLAALDRTGLLDGPAQAGLDRLIRLAARLLGVPIALVTLVDDRRQFFSSQTGLPLLLAERRETPLSQSFCRFVVASGAELIVEDARTDPRVEGHPAIAELGVVAYAGIPLSSTAGHPLGSFCAIDHHPRKWTTEELSLLRDLAEAASAEIQLRAVVRTAETATRRLAVLSDASRALSASLKVETIISLLAQITVPRLADLCTIDLHDDEGHASMPAAIAAVDPALEASMSVAERMGSRAANASTAVHRVAVTGQPILMASVDDEYVDRVSISRDQALRYRALGLSAAIIVPLVARGQVLGVLTLLATESSGRIYDEEDLSLAVELGQRGGLAIDNARLFTAEHNVAVALQRSLLPRLPKVAGLRLAARYIVSADGAAVGGDWYDVLALPDGSTGLAIGDVMGHDIRAAAAMGQLRSVLRSYAWERSSPALVLDRMDRLVQGLGMADLATAIYARLEPRAESGNMTLRWANAGHLPPILLRPDGKAQLLEGAGSVMIGVGPADSPRTEASMVLAPGSTVALYTDGVIEDRRKGLDQSLASLLAIAERHRPADGPDVLCERLLKLNPDPGDDVAILVAQIV